VLADAHHAARHGVHAHAQMHWRLKLLYSCVSAGGTGDWSYSMVLDRWAHESGGTGCQSEQMGTLVLLAVSSEIECWDLVLFIKGYQALFSSTQNSKNFQDFLPYQIFDVGMEY
jgi:hypothetical protein